MKKLVLGMLLTYGMVSVAMADTAVFDSSKMQCGEHHLSQDVTTKDLKEFNCNKLSVKKTDVKFWDDNSKKLVSCKIDKSGNLTVATCK